MAKQNWYRPSRTWLGERVQPQRGQIVVGGDNACVVRRLPRTELASIVGEIKLNGCKEEGKVGKVAFFLIRDN